LVKRLDSARKVTGRDSGPGLVQKLGGVEGFDERLLAGGRRSRTSP